MGEDYIVSHVDCWRRARCSTLRRSRRALRSHRPPRTIAAKPRGARQPPDPDRFPFLCLGDDRAGPRLRAAVRRKWRGQDQPPRSGLDARAGPRASRRRACRTWRGRAAAAAGRSRHRLGDVDIGTGTARDRARAAAGPDQRRSRVGEFARRMAVGPVADARDGPAVHRQRGRAPALSRPAGARA